MTKLAVILLITILNIVSVFASSPLGLEESIDLALENNKGILAEEQAFQASRWSEYNMLSNFFPQATFNTTAVRIDDKTYERATQTFKIPVFGADDMPTGDYIPFSPAALNGLYRTSYRTNFTVRQPIFTGGRIFLGYQMARLARQQAGNMLADKENDVRHQVTGTYFSILKMHDLQETVKKNIRASEASLQKVLQMKDVGMARQTDVLQWQVRLEEYRTTQRELDFNIAMLLELWNNQLGFSLVTYHPAGIEPGSFDEHIERFASKTGDEIEAYLAANVQLLIENNPQMQNIEITRELAGKNYTIAKGNFLPSLNLQFSYDLEESDKLDFSGESSWNIAAVLSFPLFRGGANYTNLRKARAEEREAEYASSAVEDFLITETRRLSRELITNALQVENSKVSRDYAQENYQIMNNLFEQGMITSSEFLDAETMLFAAETNVIAAYYDFITTRYELNKYTTFKGAE